MATVQTEFSEQFANVQRDAISHRRRERNKEYSQSYWARELSLEQAPDYSAVSWKARFQALRRYGDFTLAYSTAVQPLLKHFGDENGYLAFRKRFGVTVVLGDPVADTNNCRELIQSFIEQHRHSVFCQVSENTAKLLSDLGFYVNEIGVDTRIDLDNYCFRGREKEWLRYASNWTQRRGFRIVRSDFDQRDIDVDRVEAISEAWRKTRTVKRKEIRFLNRPIVLEPESDVRRYFLLDSERVMQAFVFFDPLYRDREVIGYVTSIKRRHPDAPAYAEQAIMKAAIEDMKFEGIQCLRLGLSPFANISDDHFSHGRLMSKLLRWAFQSRLVNRKSYNLQGHAQYKKRFRGAEEKMYFASPSSFNVRSLPAVIGLCGVA